MISATALAVIVLAVLFSVVGGVRPQAASAQASHQSKGPAQPNHKPQPVARVPDPAPTGELTWDIEPRPLPVLASREREWDQFVRPTCLRRGNVGLASAA